MENAKKWFYELKKVEVCFWRETDFNKEVELNE